LTILKKQWYYYEMNRPYRLALALIAGVLSSGAAYAQSPVASSFDPIRPPATPLIVRQPYVSTWQGSDTLYGKWPSFWAGHDKPITGMVRIDGVAYTFLGSPIGANGPLAPTLQQTSLRVTPTQSFYTFTGAGVTLNVDFLSPVEATDIRRQSIPLGYIIASATSNDGAKHAVQVYFDVTGQWASGDDSAQITWQKETLPDPAGPLLAFSATPANPNLLQENGDSATWGQAVWATRSQPNITTQAGADVVVRGAFAQGGVLDNSVDTNQPRAINDRWPVFAFAYDLGQVSSKASQPITLTLGNVRNPSVSYQGTSIPPLWLSYWPDWKGMTTFFLDDATSAEARATTLDKRVTGDATKAGGAKYAAICDLAFRQAFGATELVGTADHPWMFMKEISSDGNISTIDVMYPSFPVFLYANPTLLKLQLDPLFDYAESGKWTQDFAEHDIGASYPRADGHNDGGGENMPVEESANMLIMTASYLRYAPIADAQAYAKLHYKILKQWADYLLKVPDGGTYSNALDPLFQNQTDDFTGPIAHSVNLALKGILGVGAMGQIAGYAGEKADQSTYASAATTAIAQWAKMGQSTTGKHMTMQYIEGDTPQPSKPGPGIIGAHSITFGGSSGIQSAGPVVDTNQSYTVAAWVNPSALGGFQTYVSIDGSRVSGFYLQLMGNGKFGISGVDPGNPGNGAHASANDNAAVGTWYHLAGVYDAGQKTLSLYVNGVLQQTVPYLTSFTATGATAIGRGLWDGNKVDFAKGSVDDVRFYQSALSASDILSVAQDGTGTLPTTAAAPASNPVAGITAKPVAYWTFDDPAATTIVDESGNNHNLSLKSAGADPQDAWSLKYNAFPDKILGLNIVPANILLEEANYYKSKVTPFGIALDIRHSYTKGDWELWTAASTDDAQLRQDLIDGVYNFANTSNARVPFSDWYDTISGQQTGFQARPVIGGLFAVLDRTALKPNKK
jgi:hypothetical protein